MSKRLKEYTADHRYLLEVVARQAGFSAPVAIDLNAFYVPLLKTARKGEILPLDGVLVRDWHPDNRRSRPGVSLGLRFYDVEGIRFVSVGCNSGESGTTASGGGRSDMANTPRARNTPRRIGEVSVL